MKGLTSKTALHQYDELFDDVLGSLSINLLETVQSATNQILDISKQFLSVEASKVIDDFHHLYSPDSHFDELKDAVDQGVDQLITLVQKNDSGNVNELVKSIEEIDTNQMAATRLSFSALQKDMEALIRLEDDIKYKVLPIFHGLQFEDLLSSLIKSIVDIWHQVINDIHQSDVFDAKTTLTKIYLKLNCEQQRSLFLQTVLKENYPDSAIDIPAELLSRYIGNTPPEELKEKIMCDLTEFTSSTLKWNERISSEAIDPILQIIVEVRETSISASNISDDSIEALEKIKQVVDTVSHSSKKAATKILLGSIQNRIDIDDTIDELVRTIMTSVQFQDRIRQNMENLSKSILSWRSLRSGTATENELSEESKKTLGTKLIDNMTMSDERDIIRNHIPNLPIINTNEEEDDFELF